MDSELHQFVEFDMVEEGQVGLAGVNIPGLSSFSSGLRNALSAEGVDPGDVDSMKVLSGTFEMTSQGGIRRATSGRTNNTLAIFG